MTNLKDWNGRLLCLTCTTRCYVAFTAVRRSPQSLFCSACFTAKSSSVAHVTGSSFVLALRDLAVLVLLPEMPA